MHTYQSLASLSIKFTNANDKTYYWGIDEEKKDNKYTVVDDWVSLPGFMLN